MAVCSIENCGRKIHCKGYCRPHYGRWRRWGNPAGKRAIYQRVNGTPELRFWAKLEPVGDCWIWTANTDHHGYGRFMLDGRSIPAHRWCYELLRVEIPTGLQLDHLCRVRSCVNPWHLEPVTAQINTDRGILHNGNKKACPRGHPYDTENTIYVDRRDGGLARHCKTCLREKTRERRAASQSQAGRYSMTATAPAVAVVGA